jgi:ribosomal protein L29
MDKETHIIKYARRKKAALDHELMDEVSESILDDYRAAAGHLINAYTADHGVHEQNFDRLTRTIRANSHVFSSKQIADELSDVYENLKTLRGSLVYGGRKNGDAIEEAKQLVARIKELVGIDPDAGA